jgi:hypothetical protein
MNRSTFESMSRVLLAVAVAALAGVLAFGANHEAIAQSPMARCEAPGSRKEAAVALNSMLDEGRTEFLTFGPSNWLCGW